MENGEKESGWRVAREAEHGEVGGRGQSGDHPFVTDPLLAH